MSALRLTRRLAIKARDTATNQIHASIVTDHGSVAGGGYAIAMSSLARRWAQLDTEAAQFKA